VLDELAGEERVERRVLERERAGVGHEPSNLRELGAARGQEVVVDVAGHDREGPVRPDLGEQAPPAARVEHAAARRDVPEEDRLELREHGCVQLEQERLGRRVPVAGVHAVVVGAQDRGVRDLPRHEPVLEDLAVGRAQDELDADDGVENVVGVRPGVDGGLPTAAGRLPPDRLGPDRPEVDPQRRLGVALRKRENPIPDVGFGVTLAQMGVQVDGEDVAGGASDPAPEPDRSASGAEVDLGVERLDPGHERPQDSRGPKLTVKALPCQSVQSFAGSATS
jgi:hypothetical protein